MKSLMSILPGLYGSWHFTDLASDSSLQRVLAPLGGVIFFIALALFKSIILSFLYMLKRTHQLALPEGHDGIGNNIA